MNPYRLADKTLNSHSL